MTETHKPVSLPWVEKYRPKTVDEVSYQEEVIKTLKKSIQTGNLPHLLFYGPPGTGKTSTILALAKQLFGPNVHKRVMELNASDERGIDVIRTKVRNFSQVAVSQQTEETISRQGPLPPSSKFQCPPYKIIILDEADSMTRDAQAALRRTMEQYSHITRFCLICNYISRIIEPLTSRCAKFRFKPLATTVIVERLSHICRCEQVTCSGEVLDTLVQVSEGDMRKAITCLQSAHTFHGVNITPENVMSIAGVVPSAKVDQLFKACKSNSFEALQPTVANIIADGYSTHVIISQLHDRIVGSMDLKNNQKAHILEALANSDKCLIDGADEYLQLLATTSLIMNEMNK